RVLREALGDAAKNPRFIETEPKLGYRFIAPVSAIAHNPPAPDPVPALRAEIPRPTRSPRRLVWAAAILPVAAAAAWTVLHVIGLGAGLPPRANVTQLTHLLGLAGHPSFSPDGARVAFHWNGAARGAYDIYTLRLGSEDLKRLTAGPADSRNPAWSPDGRDIAFLRTISDTGSALMIAPALGGAERTVAVLPKVLSLAWSPNGRWVAYSLASSSNEQNPAAREGVRAISLSTGETIDVTPPGDGDSYPAFSRDGRKLAFVRHADLWMVDLGDALRPVSPPRRLTFDAKGVSFPMWTPDGGSILFAAERGANAHLWRLSPGRAAAGPVEVGGDDGYEPAMNAGGGRLVYSRVSVVDSLSALSICKTPCSPELPVKLLYSAKVARNPSVSPDGRRIAVELSRAGRSEIWLCDRDGSNLKQLTDLGGPPAGSPSWSPDGRQIAFDARLQNGSAVFTIAATGGAPHQLTNGTEDLVPSWSNDGKRIYFSSNRTRQLQIWGMPVGGGDAVQITRGEGFRPIESHDGRYVYYAKGAFETSIWRVPAGGGEETRVVPSLGYWQNFSITDGGIYFVPESAGANIPIHFFDFEARVSRVVGAVDGLSAQGISASPDNRTLIFSRRESNDRDLMLIEFPK
ncbi:MAG: hypothetical protein LAQ30_02950, partial [Acidobacteriia bacterium]|nr:hypothetical protein [Terriglobia bacterium]